MMDVVTGPPLNGIVEIAGPEKISLVDLVRKYARIMRLKEEVVSDENVTYFGAKLNNETLIPGTSAKLGKIRYDEWIRNPQNQR